MHEPERFRSPAYLAVLDATPQSLCAQIDAVALAAMRRIGEAGYPHERCGLLIGVIAAQGWTVVEAREVANLNTERAADRFELDPEGYRAIDRELRGSGREIVGIFHSHPDAPAKPSPTDLTHAWEGFLYPIVAVQDGRADEIRLWSLNEQATAFAEIELARESA